MTSTGDVKASAPVAKGADTQVKKWYVVRAVSGKEKKVKQQIESEVTRHNLQRYVSQVLIPMEKYIQIKEGKKLNKERSYFPGYVLLEAVLVGELPHVIRAVPGVIGFLGSKKGDDPIPLRPAEANRILGKVDELSESDAEMNIKFLVGESIKIIDGPFNSFVGTIEEVNDDKKRLKVSVKIFGRKTPLELTYMQVKKES
ncbi:MAG: transcription termination/antitermination factor NusG [Bacteroidia bacterium]|jgi:transcriptional antiterminator NusG|nr:transcription termination/antitermination factor NusG [Bacteroidia bacterium]